ncbi:hypothetical protein Pla110_19580 [Polystyrenella longa]|uniref:Uncharacterized protein n=1 Tax=Polystyrenella longa TaxID=2528007 RepID=A0A518CM22_9PLAN|nr:hypothetical protein [Polystyrenella longa]QDU80234.1 hypothetical protein Pla110_19580 [Polystyrenella longa]
MKKIVLLGVVVGSLICVGATTPVQAGPRSFVRAPARHRVARLPLRPSTVLWVRRLLRPSTPRILLCCTELPGVRSSAGLCPGLLSPALSALSSAWISVLDSDY